MMHDPDIQITAPSVFAENPVEQVSKHYTFIPTTTLINDFRKLGWEVDRATQQRSKINPIHTKHRVTFRNASFPSINGVFPELIMVNSHDRTAAFNFMLGLFRLVCSNGLVVQDKQLENLRVRHIGYKFDDIEALTETIMLNMPAVMQTMTRLQRIQLTKRQQTEFAVRAFAVRFKEYVGETGKVDTLAINKAVDISQLLNPIREEDADNSIWTVYNRIQEKLIKGGFQRIGTKDNQSKRVRPITNIKLDIDVNRTLWEMATNYANNLK